MVGCGADAKGMLGCTRDQLIRMLFVAGMATSALAADAGVSQRRVRQLVADLRPAAREREPTDDELDAMIMRQRWELGQYWGIAMMEGALHGAYPGIHCSRRRVQEALERLFPHEMEQRKYGRRTSDIHQLAYIFSSLASR